VPRPRVGQRPDARPDAGERPALGIALSGRSSRTRLPVHLAELERIRRPPCKAPRFRCAPRRVRLAAVRLQHRDRHEPGPRLQPAGTSGSGRPGRCADSREGEPRAALCGGPTHAAPAPGPPTSPGAVESAAIRQQDGERSRGARRSRAPAGTSQYLRPPSTPAGRSTWYVSGFRCATTWSQRASGPPDRSRCSRKKSGHREDLPMPMKRSRDARGRR